MNLIDIRKEIYVDELKNGNDEITKCEELKHEPNLIPLMIVLIDFDFL